MSEFEQHKPVKHDEAEHHDNHDDHDKEHWLERNWGLVVIAFGLVCLYFLDTFAPVH